MSDQKQFQRMNFFKGFFTTAEDWQRGQAYHVEKRKLHNRSFYTPGIVSGLHVSVTERGGLIVESGYALDAEGHDIYLPDTADVEPIPKDLQHSPEAFLSIQYAEQRIEKRANVLNQKDEYAFTLEKPVFAWQKEAPDNKGNITLAKLLIRPGRKTRKEDIESGGVVYAVPRQLGSVAVRVKSGRTDVDPSRTPQFSKDDDRITIERFGDENAAMKGLYIANVFPVPTDVANDARIQWRIESSTPEPGATEYHLYIKNFGTQPATVRYEVCRLAIHPTV